MVASRAPPRPTSTTAASTWQREGGWVGDVQLEVMARV